MKDIYVKKTFFLVFWYWQMPIVVEHCVLHMYVKVTNKVMEPLSYDINNVK